jgi:MoaA/NifB/PqqE/SkfB family radical SAM enzyme
MLRCSFCVNDDGPDKRQDIIVERAIEALHELQNAPKELGSLKRVFFTGGEPLLRMNIIEQVASALPKDIFTSVVTNGILLTPENVDRLKAINLTRIKVSYDTTNAADFVTIRNGASLKDFARIEQNLEYAAQSGMLLYLRVALGRLNVGVLNDIYRKAMDIGVDTVQIKPIISSGRALENKDSLSLSPEELSLAFEKLGNIYDEKKTKISVSCFPPAANFGLPIKVCANNQKFYWEVNGDIYTCNYIQDKTNYLGNYFEKNGVEKALLERQRRYGELFNENRAIANCPAIDNYRPLPKIPTLRVAKPVVS